MPRNIVIGIVALLLGFMITSQSKSFDVASNELTRDTKANIFQEINVLKQKNDSLNKEIKELEATLAQLNNQNSALAAIQDQIEKLQKLTGDYPIYGPGLSIMVDQEVSTLWLLDIINESFHANAEAVSINGIRITNKTIGLDSLPQGQSLLNGSILSAPYIFNVIGEPTELRAVLEAPGSVLKRISGALPNVLVSIEQKEILYIN